ncbi:MAG: hypothetical protein N3C12_05725 [Candidatus Binatia bacterium]|nr:hypothetical protein [Candidatus Binatia bacterium]
MNELAGNHRDHLRSESTTESPRTLRCARHVVNPNPSRHFYDQIINLAGLPRLAFDHDIRKPELPRFLLGQLALFF